MAKGVQSSAMESNQGPTAPIFNPSGRNTRNKSTTNWNNAF
ncbi:uncharacterized protein G2W53_027301 [Senna tora]|uniref:Uncharacterized protein n=1 Tax=Senna tora TaxID=362788 RepID=A0A834TJ47_9FABA|nr:uncharacterized protein G2W53_027301 [Senna tora]